MKLLPVLAILAVSASTGLASRLVCYYTNWSRFGKQPFNVEDIDSTLCTHLVYSFLGLENDGRIKSVDPWNDFGDEWTEGGLKKFIKLKNANPSVKLLLGVGGWNEGPVKFQSMVRDPAKRKAFLESTLAFVRQYKFDGLEIDWVYHGGEGTAADKAGLSELVKEMKPKYEQAKFVLSLTTSANHHIVDKAYDIATLSKHVDFINIMAYDLHGSWDKKTGHVAPLHAMKGENEEEKKLNVEAAINMYISRGATPEKLNLAVVSYGRTFTLADPNKNGFGAPATGPGNEEPLPYRSFCVQDKNNKWTKQRNQEQAVPYAYAGNQWVGYEDSQSLTDKVKFSKSKKLGGISFWSFDFDDFKGACGPKYPLLRAVKEELSRN